MSIYLRPMKGWVEFLYFCCVLIALFTLVFIVFSIRQDLVKKLESTCIFGRSYSCLCNAASYRLSAVLGKCWNKVLGTSCEQSEFGRRNTIVSLPMDSLFKTITQYVAIGRGLVQIERL